MRVLATVLLVGVACGGSSTNRDAGGNDDGGMDGSIGIDAAPVEACPADPPNNTDSCVGFVNRRCLWERCTTTGMTIALCGDSNGGPTWNVQSIGCDQLTCQGGPCASGEVCAVSAGGALLEGCMTHTCGTGPVTCECVCGSYQCTEGDSSGSGDGLFTCNTCPEGNCP